MVASFGSGASDIPKVGSYRIREISVDLIGEFHDMPSEQTEAAENEQNGEAQEEDLTSGRLSGGRQVPRSVLAFELAVLRNVHS